VRGDLDLAAGGGDGERVEIVDTESNEADLFFEEGGGDPSSSSSFSNSRFLLRSASILASSSSATPFLNLRLEGNM